MMPVSKVAAAYMYSAAAFDDDGTSSVYARGIADDIDSLTLLTFAGRFPPKVA